MKQTWTVWCHHINTLYYLRKFSYFHPVSYLHNYTNNTSLFIVKVPYVSNCIVAEKLHMPTLTCSLDTRYTCDSGMRDTPRNV